MSEENKLIVRDWLAIERTKLANERTFLSYFRSSFVLFGTGLGIFKVEIFSDVAYVGLMLMIVSPLLLFWGMFRFFKVKKVIAKRYS